MFTGLVEGIGEVKSLQRRGSEAVFTIVPPFEVRELREGESVSVEGACLTVAGIEGEGFAAYASGETLGLTTLGGLAPGSGVNIERALRLDARVGGHLVTGHVDGLGRVEGIRPEGDSVRMWFTAPEELSGQIVRKGSIAVNGVSLTVNEAEGAGFSVNLIPHTMKVTTLGRLKKGSRVNIETDIIGKYVERLLRAHLEKEEGKIDEEFLKKHGF